ncbi:hypothetical protein EMIT0P260_20432 [Pseudomonas sp. IT-P260]
MPSRSRSRSSCCKASARLSLRLICMESAVFMAFSLIPGAIHPNPHANGGAIRSVVEGGRSGLWGLDQVLEDQRDGDGVRFAAGWIGKDSNRFTAVFQIEASLASAGAQLSVCQARQILGKENRYLQSCLQMGNGSGKELLVVAKVLCLVALHVAERGVLHGGAILALGILLADQCVHQAVSSPSRSICCSPSFFIACRRIATGATGKQTAGFGIPDGLIS